MRTFLTPGLATALVLLLLAGCSPDPEVPVPLRERTNPRDGSVLIEIPAGEFVMGSDEYRNSKPRFNLNLPTYWIGKHEITNRQFAAFVRATGVPGGRELAPALQAGPGEPPRGQRVVV